MKLEGQTRTAGPIDTVGIRTPPRPRRPAAIWPLLVLMGLLSLGGFVGGISFVLDRTGADLGAKLSWLDRTPVHDFLLPGLFLLGVYGIGSLVLMIGLAWRFSPGPLRRVDQRLGHHWSWVGTGGVGAILVLWILYEFWIFPDRVALQPILIGLGMSMIALCSLPSTRRHYASRQRTG
jgi:hypothetical protein